MSTRDFYMRRNLAIVFAGRDSLSNDWIRDAAGVADAAAAEAGQVLLVLPAGMASHGLPVIVDDDGRMRSRFGLEQSNLPALFITDRYGALFAASHGDDAIHDLGPRDIPRWLEFIACRCS
jgi:hypothetical protein